MLKGEQELMRLKIYKKEATQNKHVNIETKQTKIKVSGQRHHARQNRPAYAESSLCVQARSCFVYADPYPENLKTQKQRRTLKQQTSNLKYTKYEKN